MSSSRILLCATIAFGYASALFAAPAPQRNRITEPVRDSRRVRLSGQIPGKFKPENDQGPVDPGLRLHSLTLVLKPSAEQQMALDQLLAQQQDPASPDYRRWLTPEEYADRFGVSTDDLQKIVAWLGQQSLTVTGTGRARNWVSFSGTAQQVENAFATEIHNFLVDGEVHFSNVTEPALPEALEAVVRGIHGLNNLRFKPRHIKKTQALPKYTSSRGNHYLSPDDIAVIYNLNPLFRAGINGAGQKIVVVGQTQIDLADVRQFRSYFQLPANDPEVILVPDARDPGVVDGDQTEAHLDIEWAGAVARNAGVVYVYSSDVIDALQYAIDQNLAPVLSMSYGFCEPAASLSEALSLRSLARQANAQGMTWLTASGDSGGADCVAGNSRSGGLAVDLPAAVPEVTAVGGTEFNEGGGTYWDTANTAGQASVLSYIPEAAWNDSADGDPAAGGGGASIRFEKPSWQVGAGVPADGARDVPDIALASSAQHDGYLIFDGGDLGVVGGTSVAAPVFAGIAALLNHRLVSSGIAAFPGLGNMNPKLYSLAQTSPGVFHDIVAGDNIVTVTCGTRTRNCTAGTFGYSSGPGYDQVTGLGSVDAFQLVSMWTPTAPISARSTAAMSLTADRTGIAPGDSATLTATVSGQNGGTPTGSVTFYSGTTVLGTVPLAASIGAAKATLATTATGTIVVQYSGNSAYEPASATISIAVLSTSGPPAITGVANGASFRQAFAPGMVLTVFGSQLAPFVDSAPAVPLPVQLAGVSATVNGIAAPLYYVSPTQVNLQVPYEAGATGQAVVTISNGGQTASATFAMSAAAPGIFNTPLGTAARGQYVTLYVTGAGAVSPLIATGAAPPPSTPLTSLPAPVQPVVVTVGGAQAPVQFAGIPYGLAGVVQINFQVPADAPPGNQPVIVSVGGVASPQIALTVQ